MGTVVSLLLLTTMFGAADDAAQGSAAARPRDLNAMVDDFATCAVRTDAETARAAVLADDMPRAVASVRRLLRTSCGSELRRNRADFILDVPVAALAGGLVRSEFAVTGPRSFPDHSTTTVPAESSVQTTSSGTARQRARALYAANRARNARIGDCVVRADPEGARQWVLAGSGDGNGVTPSASFAPFLSGCLTQAGVRATQPNVIALSYYRLAYQSPRDASGATN